MNKLTTTTASPTPNSTDPAPRTWMRTIGTTGQIIETCPPECKDSHVNDKVGALDDLTHGYNFAGPQLPVFDAEEGTALVPILAGRVQIDPYSRDLKRRRPHLNFEPFQDEVMECLTPDEFAQIIATIRAHCDQLDQVHAEFAKLHDQWTEPQA